MTMIKQIGTCHSGENNHPARQIWEWSISRNVWLKVVHIPGKQNTEEGEESRLSGKETEWTLQPSLFKAASDKLGVIRGIDLFASRLKLSSETLCCLQARPGGTCNKCVSCVVLLSRLLVT